jgi:hypothetical protein
MRVVLRDPPLLLMIAAILLDLPLSRVPRRPATELAAWPDLADWPRRFFGSIPPRTDVA